MRALALLLTLLPFLGEARVNDSLAAARGTRAAYDGLQRYDAGRPAAALRPLQQAFRRAPAEDLAAAYYYSLVQTGHDLEALLFRSAHPELTYALQDPGRRGLLYADMGPRLVNTSADAGDLRYLEGGVVLRIGSRSRLWQSLNLVQDATPSRYRQAGSHSTWDWYAGKQWMLGATLQSSFTQFSYLLDQNRAVHYEAAYPYGFNDSLHFKTDAAQFLRYTATGEGQSLYGSLRVQRRIGSWNIALEPGYQLLRREYGTAYRYLSLGTTDSFLEKNYLGTLPFVDSGSGSSDTLVQQAFFQLGGMMTHHFNLARMPMAITLGVWGLRGRDREAGAAYASIWVEPHPSLWLTLTAFHKGALPVAFSPEGVYFSFYNPVRYRAGIRAQLFPHRRLSPALAYQLENSRSSAAGTKLLYHAAYLTLKYAL